jgi:hypothetical protein
MDDEIKDIRIIQIMALIATGKAASKIEACRMMNISVSTYDRALENKPSLRDDFIRQAKQPLQDLFQDIQKARVIAIGDFIDSLTDPEVSTKTKLSVYTLLKQEAKELELELGFFPTEPGDVPNIPQLPGTTAAEEYIKKISPPKLKAGKNISLVEKTTTVYTLEEDPIVDAEEGEELP